MYLDHTVILNGTIYKAGESIPENRNVKPETSEPLKRPRRSKSEE